MSIVLPGLPGGIPLEEARQQPKMLVDTPEGKFCIPIVVLADFQFEELVNRIKQAVWGDLPPMAAPPPVDEMPSVTVD